MGRICPFCGTEFKPDHYVTCKMTGQQRNIRHNNIVVAIAKQINEDKKAKVVCVAENNMGDSRDKPDLEF